MRLRWTTEALGDLDRLIYFLIGKDPKAALSAINTIENAAAQLPGAPEIGTALNDGTPRRELYIKFGKNGYTLRYVPDYEASLIYILRAWHSREERD